MHFAKEGLLLLNPTVNCVYLLFVLVTEGGIHNSLHTRVEP